MSRTRLYRPVFHVVLRGIAGAFVAVGFVMLVGMTVMFAFKPVSLLLLLAWPLYLATALTLRAMALRLRRVYASTAGLVVARRGDEETIPWNRVGEVEWPWWWRPTFRRFHFAVHQIPIEGARPILFCPTAHAAEEIARFRAGTAAKDGA